MRGWRHYNETGDNAVRLGLSVAIPIWDQNRGDIFAAEQNVDKMRAEQAANRAALVLVAGRAYDTLTASLRELQILRDSTIPTARTAADAIQDGYGQGRFTLLEVLDVLSTRRAGLAARAGSAAKPSHRDCDDRRPGRQSLCADPGCTTMSRILKASVVLVLLVAAVFAGMKILEAPPGKSAAKGHGHGHGSAKIMRMVPPRRR